MKEVKKLAGQTLVYGLGTIVPRFLHYAVLTPFYTRIFIDTRDYGVVTELYAWMVVLLVILTYGMETGYFRFVQNRKDSEKVYSAALISLFTTSIIFIALANIFITPVSAMPSIVAFIAELFPLTHFLEITRGIIISGLGIKYLWRHVVALGVFAIAVIVISIMKFKKSLE